MSTLNLEHVDTFLALVRTGSFRGAAQERGLTQGGVSQHIGKLETVLGARLIARAARGCLPTANGAAFLPFAESLMRLNARAFAVLQERRIALGASSNIGVYLLQPYVKSYLAETGGQFPVDLHIHQNPVIAHKLDTGEIDIAAMEWWDDRPGYVARRWRDEELVVIVSPQHEWAGLPCIPRDLLKGAPLLGGEPGTGTGRLLARYFGDAEIELNVTMRLGSTEAVKQWVKAGLGISLVLAGTVEEERRDGTLAVIALEGEPPRKELYVVRREALDPASPPWKFAEWLIGPLANGAAFASG